MWAMPLLLSSVKLGLFTSKVVFPINKGNDFRFASEIFEVVIPSGTFLTDQPVHHRIVYI